MKNFDAQTVAKQLRQVTILRRVKRYSRSKLDEWRYELCALRAEGVTLKELQRWLHQEGKTPCAISTISRWLSKNHA